MVQRLPLAIVLAALALLSIASSAALIVSLLHPSHVHQRLLPAQRLQLLLASLDIAIVFASAASLCDVVFRHSQPPPSPFSDAPTTFALCLCLLLRPAIVCAFATNSFATIWLDRSAASRLKLFLPPSLAAVFVSAACALVTGIYGDGAAYDSGMTIGQAVTSAWTISCVALLAIVTTLAIGGIIWAVWASSQQQGGHNRNSNRLLGFPPSPRPHEPRGAIAEHRELEPILMQPVAATRTEFGVIPPKASVHTFGHGRPIGSLDTGRRIDQALQGTLCRSEQTATTLANWGGAGAPVATTLASTLDAYDSYSRRDAQGSGIDGDAHRDLDQTAGTTAAAAADFSIQHAYDHAFDGTFASPEPSFSREAPDSDTRAPSGILRPTITPQIGRTTGSDRSRRLAARASRLSTCSHSEALLRRVRSTGFVLVDSHRLRRDAAGQGFDESSASVASAAAASARRVSDIEKGGVGQDQPCLSPSSDSAPATTLSRTEALKALSRLTGLILSVWLPFAFSLPFLTNGWTHDTRQTTSAATVVLLCLGLTLTSPLMVLQRFVAYLLEKRRLHAMREGSRSRRRAHTPPLDPSHGRDWSISTSGPVAGVGYGDCNGYDHGLLDQASAVHPRSSPAAPSPQAGPIRFSSADTFGAAVHRPSAVLSHHTGSVRSRSGAKRSSSVKSVAYSDRHWAGRRGSGDRVEPRSPFWPHARRQRASGRARRD
ncbi:uncharacterized protein PFL1_04526 [Pseudozyma flocculosa PF-1]|uniref:Uncharacterized protein n=1 Tax=Pseudozyma flocculosa PF-1 TaxID=1277687 RepID=A0A061HB05_9BASI|nr:uncharacterized protein PFL1_04526 [Pseudozyma flocculosa PF-1]EPQ27781.1 hypothetical protein PFL1_04526 [Pseudozyma flocculosa PF-1]